MPACAQHLLGTITTPWDTAHMPRCLPSVPLQHCRASEGCGERQLIWSPLWPTSPENWDVSASQVQPGKLWISCAGADSRFQQAVLGDIVQHDIPSLRISLLLLNLLRGIPYKEQGLSHVVSISICNICCWMALVKSARDCVLLLLLM